VLSLAFIHVFAWAGSSSGSPVSVEALKKALAKYQNVKTLDVDFHQTKTIKDMKGGKLESSGHLRVERPARVLWKIVRPEPLNVTLDAEKIVITGSDGSTETFKAADAASPRDRRNLEDMLNWLKLDAVAISSSFNVMRLNATTLVFEPKHEGAAMKKLEMSLNPKGDVRELKFLEASGDEMTLSFGQPKIARE
jgi:outer membrane lipoprotein-sorting protein